MLKQTKASIERHIAIHTERSAEDRSAVGFLKSVFAPGGRINDNFSADDKWPNHDGTFELVPNPEVSRRPKQNFFVQIKGTHVYEEKNGVVKYSLKSLGFPAFICQDVSLDPGILFVVLDPDMRGNQRIFWKYMSVDFLNSINFDNNSMTVTFSADEEIFNTDQSIAGFCETLESIIEHHSFVNQLDSRDYSRRDVERIITNSAADISESIDRLAVFNDTRDGVSRRILTRLNDLCASVLLLNAIDTGVENASLPLAWELSMLNVETKYLGTFLKGLQYIGRRIPDEGQSERLMLKYYDFLWQIRKSLFEKYRISVLDNLEKFPLHLDEVDAEYYESVARAVETVARDMRAVCPSRYYVQKKTPFFVGKERYYEVTLQLAGLYASKYNRITAYTKKDISTDYAVKIGYADATIDLWNVASTVKIITNWIVSVEPRSLNRLAKILRINLKLNANYGEYAALMSFLTRTGLNLLELIDLQEAKFQELVEGIYKGTNTDVFKQVLYELQRNYSRQSEKLGHNVIRYLLLSLRSDTIESVLPTSFHPKCIGDLYLSTRCYPFERNPFISNLAGSKTTENQHASHIADVAGYEKLQCARPYLEIKSAIKRTGEIYFKENAVGDKNEIQVFNDSLDTWERKEGYYIVHEDDSIFIESYEKRTLYILRELINRSKVANKGQLEFNKKFLKQSGIDFSDPLKEQALRDVFVNSQILLIYGAAGTGKTTLINYISNLMSSHKKLFLTKTHTALQNLKCRIENPGNDVEFISLNSFTKKVVLDDYDVIFVDECSTIDNRTMAEFFKKVGSDTFIVMAGDIHQIESIEFGNWFCYAKDLIKTQGAFVELLSNWRTEDVELISLWNEVRTKDVLITEKLSMDGPYSEDISPNLLVPIEDDEVVLCLNYDGKFGLNNINRFFQNANQSKKVVGWHEWTYKTGDRILFNETERFAVLYNNLKGKIVNIEERADEILFTIDVETVLTEKDCKREEIEFIAVQEDSTRIRFAVCKYDEEKDEEDEALQLKSIIPFQLAYAVSIHKAQGLEYDSVKVIIPSSNAEKITHGIFYTAITRAKKKLKIYWSSETMKDIVCGFYEDESRDRSLEIIKTKLQLK